MDPSSLMSVLAEGGEQARKLKAAVNAPLDAESCKSLVRQVQSSFETAIAIAKSLGGGSRAGTSVIGSDSGGSESPQSENSDGGLKDKEPRELMCKKRKGLPKWGGQVRVGSEGGIEGPLDDGYSWRKYGQKDILGAKYPRGYYRCTHRNTQACPATKQVQRSDNDPNVFDVSYRGVHTCVEKPNKAQASPKRFQHKPRDSGPHPQAPLDQQQLLMSLRASLTVKTEGLEADIGGTSAAGPSSFYFPSTPVSCMQAQSNMFLSPPAQDSQFSAVFSPAFMPASTWPNVQGSESELADIISAATSAANSPLVDMDFVQFDPNFPFDGSNFF